MKLARIVTFALCLLMMAWPLAAQTTTGGSITGTVLDPQGAVVPEAAVTATNVDQNTSFKTTTNNAGIFVFTQLLPARYAVTVEKQGFNKYEQKGLVLHINDRLSVGNITLEVGSAVQTVEVVAQGLQLQTESAERTGTIVGTQLQNIEVDGRSPLSLLRTLPGVVFNMDTSRTKNRIENIWINGSRMNSLNATLNGASVTGTGDNTKLMATVSLDSLQEFKVLASNYQAQYGKAAGGTIMMVTKSGGSDFHGSAYWYYRDKGMNANSWDKNRDLTPDPTTGKVPKSQYHYNYLGYTIGGPVYLPGRFNTNKDKLFFFWSEEYQRQLIPEGLRKVTVPTALERQGDFSESVDKNGNPFPYIRDPLATSRTCNATDTTGCFADGGVLGKIPADRLYGPGLDLLNIFPLPNVTGQKGYNFQSAVSSSNPRHERLIRLDSNLSQDWRLFGSVTQLVQDVETGAYGPQGYSLTPNYPFPSGGAAQYDHPGYSVSVNLTTTIDPTSTNEVTYGMAHHLVTVLPSNPSDVTRAGTGVYLPTFYEPYADWIPEVSWNGTRIANQVDMRTGGGAFSPFSTYNTTIELADNYTKIWDKHLFKAGIYMQRNRKNQSAFVQSGGFYDFGDSSSNPLDTQFGFANAAAGVFTSFQQASNYRMGEYRYTNLEMYLQDTVKVSRRLTLDLGLRAYLVQPQYDQRLQTSTFFPNEYDPTQAVQLFWPCYDASGTKIGVNRQDCDASAPGAITTAQYLPSPASLFIGKIVPNSGNLTNGILPAGVGINKYLMEYPGILWAPRFGMAVDLTGHGNLVFRAGAGAFYDRYQGNEIFNTITNPPAIFTPTAVNGFVEDLSPSNALIAPSDLTVISYDGKVPTIYNYSAGIQARLPWATTIDVSYVGSLGRQLLFNTNINGAPYGTAFTAESQDPTKWGFGNTPTPGPDGLFDGSKAYDSNYVRPYFGYGNINLERFGATSNYSSLQVSVDRRFAKGLFLGVAYTWGKCLTMASSDGDAGRIDNLTRLANYGPCSYDIRQNLTFNYVYQIPGVKGNRIGRALLGGWQVSGITVFRNDAPLTPGYSIGGVSTVMLTGTGAFGARPKLVGIPTEGTSDDPYNRLNAAAFAPPTRPSIGIESPVNYVTRPGINNWDVSLQKNVTVTERAHLEFRVDAFNVFNHTQFNGLNSTVNFTCSGTNCATWTVSNLPYDSSGNLVNKTGFGTVSGVRSPRVLQIVARFVF
jgi:hypothetical protein